MAEAAETLPEISVPPFECVGELLPTPANMTNMFGTIATNAEKFALSTVEEWKDEGEKLKDVLDTFREFLVAYDPKWKRLEMPEKEWEIMIQRLMEEYPMYIQNTILQLVSKIIPINFQLPLLGLQIDLIKLVSDRAYLDQLMADVQGFGADVQAQIDGLASDLSPEARQEAIDKLRGDKLDAIYQLLPDEYKMFAGEHGFETADFKGKQIGDFIKNEAKKLQNALMTGGATALIDKFKIIWDALGLPGIDFPLNLDAKALIDAAIADAKDDVEKMAALKNIKIAGFDVMALLGGEFDDNVESMEVQIARIQTKLKEFEVNFEDFTIKTWLQKVGPFLKAIGLGPVIDLVLLDFCDFVMLMGIPTALDLSSFSSIKEVANTFDSGLPTLSASNNPASNFTEEVMSEGQTIIEGSFTEGVTVVNTAALDAATAFTDYTIESGNIVLDVGATAGTEYLVIPDSSG